VKEQAGGDLIILSQGQSEAEFKSAKLAGNSGALPSIYCILFASSRYSEFIFRVFFVHQNLLEANKNILETGNL
jgi:hypothetical protein